MQEIPTEVAVVTPSEQLNADKKCARCGRDVLWARLASGIAIALELQPDPRGVVAVVPARWGLAARLTTPAKPRQPYEAPYYPHLSICERSPLTTQRVPMPRLSL